jgi:hypothetical protein
MNRFAGFADNGGVPFEKFTPAVSRTARPRNPTKPKVRNARNVAIDDEDGFIPNSKGMTMTDIDRGPYYKMLDRQALARQSQTGESYAKAFTTPRFATDRNMMISRRRLTRFTGQRNP